MTDLEFQLDNFMLYCSSKNLSRKTLASYEQTLKLFKSFLQTEFEVTEVSKVQSGHIRQYIKYLKERGKYTVVNDEKSRDVNHPENRKDFKKQISSTTIANYIRNIKVFFNYLTDVERVLTKNPLSTIDNIKPERKGTLHIRSGKGNKQRELPLSPEVRRAITKYLDERTDSHEALFLSNRQHRISIRSVQHLMEKHGHNVHQTRHSFITGLVRAGEDISLIQALSGHTSADMVLRYSQPTEEDKLIAVERLYKS